MAQPERFDEPPGLQTTYDTGPHMTSSDHIRVMIVDDQPLIRRGLAMMLGSEPDIEIVATAEDGQQAIELSQQESPDIVIMDLQMPGTDGVTATRHITSSSPGTRVVVLTTFDHDDLVFNAIRAGAQAYLLKDTSETEVLATIKAVHRGESYLSPVIARKVMSEFRSLSASTPSESTMAASTTAASTSGQPDAAATARQTEPGNSASQQIDTIPETPLTPKEEQILSRLAEGKTNRQIAAEIHLAEGTVKNYVSRIMDKLHAQSRTELAVRAVSRQR